MRSAGFTFCSVVLLSCALFIGIAPTTCHGHRRSLFQDTSLQPIDGTNATKPPPDIHSQMVGDRSLYEVLKDLSVRNGNSGPVIIQINTALLDVGLNLYCSLRRIGIPGVLFWSTDEAAHQELVRAGLPSYFQPALFTVVSKLSYWGSESYITMMRERGIFLKMILDAEVGFWWIDADIVIKKDFRKLVNPFADFSVQLDSHRFIDWQNLTAGVYMAPCGGFYYMRSTEENKMFIDQMNVVLAANPKIIDQDAMNAVVYNKSMSIVFNMDKDSTSRNYPQRCHDEPALCKRLIKVYFFKQLDVMNGHVFWGGEAKKATFPAWSEDFYALHANGVRDKAGSFKTLGLWMFNSLTDNGVACNVTYAAV